MKTASPVPDVGGDVGGVAEEFDQVDLDVAGVGAADARGHVDAGLPPVAQPGALAADRRALGEGLEDAEEVVDAVRGPVVRGELADRHVQGGGHRAAQRLVRPSLDLAGAPEPADRRRAQCVEQDGLADAAQSGQDQAAFGPAPGDPFQDDVEDVEFSAPAGEFGWALAGAGGVGVADRIHVSHRIGPSSDRARCG